METVSRETSALADPWYVTGLVEGKGAFTYSRSGRSLVLYFSMKVSAADRVLLDTLQRYFGGVGRIYKVRSRARAPGESVSAWYYRVARVRELQHVADHFERYPLRGAKSVAFRLWRQMLDGKARLRKADWHRLDSLAQELSAWCDGAR